MIEEWKDIEGYEGSYQISSIGRVKGLERVTSRGQRIKESTIRGGIHNGYHRVSLSLEGKAKTYKVHRLVALAFKDNPENKPQVNHIDGIKTNNNLDNLEWATASENSQHAHDMGLQVVIKGSKHKNSKLTEEDIQTIFKLRADGFLQREIADVFKVSKHVVSCILSRKYWSHVSID